MVTLNLIQGLAKHLYLEMLNCVVLIETVKRHHELDNRVQHDSVICW